MFEEERESEATQVDTTSPAQESVAPAGTEASLTATPAGQPATEEKPVVEETSEADALSEESSTDYDKSLGRKYFFEVEKMGGPSMFEAAKKLSHTYFNDTPENFVKEISQYSKAYWPVRDKIVIDTITHQPEDVLAILQQTHPDLFTGNQPSQPAQDSQAFDPKSWATGVMADPDAYEQDRQLAKHILATEERLGKLPEIEQKMQRFEQSFTQTQTERVEQQTTKYVDELLSVVNETYNKSGLDKSGIDLETFQQMVVAAHGKDKVADARFRSALDAIQKGDMQTALLLQDQIKRDGEKIAFDFARKFSGAFSGATALKRQAGQTGAEQNRTLPAGVAPPLGNRSPNAPAFDENVYQSAMQDIIARS
jgi:hypothetical protein